MRLRLKNPANAHLKPCGEKETSRMAPDPGAIRIVGVSVPSSVVFLGWSRMFHNFSFPSWGEKGRGDAAANLNAQASVQEGGRGRGGEGGGGRTWETLASRCVSRGCHRILLMERLWALMRRVSVAAPALSTYGAVKGGGVIAEFSLLDVRNLHTTPRTRTVRQKAGRKKLTSHTTTLPFFVAAARAVDPPAEEPEAAKAKARSQISNVQEAAAGATYFPLAGALGLSSLNTSTMPGRPTRIIFSRFRPPTAKITPSGRDLLPGGVSTTARHCGGDRRSNRATAVLPLKEACGSLTCIERQRTRGK